MGVSNQVPLHPPSSNSVLIISVELALRFYERALDIDKTNTKVMDSIGELYADLGEVERAKEVRI